MRSDKRTSAYAKAKTVDPFLLHSLSSPSSPLCPIPFSPLGLLKGSVVGSVAIGIPYFRYSEGEYFEYSLVPTSPAFLFLRLADCLAVYSLRAIFRVQISSSVDLHRVLFYRAHTKSQPCTELPSSTRGGYLLDRISPS